MKFYTIVFTLLLFISNTFFAICQEPEQENFKEYTGEVVDSETGNPLIFVSLSIKDTNISTVTNSDGEFLLKIPMNLSNGVVMVSYLGYQPKELPIASLDRKNNKIRLEIAVINLAEVNINLPKNAYSLVKRVFKKKAENNLNKPVLMTAFYRETIKKRRRNVSLAEAIVNLYKQPYTSGKNDNIELYKTRKSTDYKRLDTIALKLQGGPYNPLYIDLMKYPEYIFGEDMIENYSFSFAPASNIDGRPVFVVKFKQRADVLTPLYYGKLFIDSNSLALISAIYNLNVEDKNLAAGLFVRKKPLNIRVYPTNATYRVDYREKDGKWYYSYGNVQLSFVVKRKRKWFNSKYSLSSEMAVTDWELNPANEKPGRKERLKKTVIITDAISGFSDPDFWGAYNVIEPEKSIESAISKIQRQLKRMEKGG